MFWILYYVSNTFNFLIPSNLKKQRKILFILLFSFVYFQLLQRLGKGAQGSVYLVEHIKEKKKYVLKKVECNDEHEANKAFKEVNIKFFCLTN